MDAPSRKLEVLAALPKTKKNVARDSAGTVKHLMGVTGMQRENVSRYLRQLYADGLAHIGYYARGISPYQPVWVQGKGPHKPKPEPMTQAEYARRHRAKLRLERAKAKVEAIDSRTKDVLAALPMPSIANSTRRGSAGTVGGVAKELGLGLTTARRHLRLLKAEGLAYIACWNRISGPMVPVWVQGNGEDAPKPRPLTSAEYNRRYRARIKKAVERGSKGFEYDERYKGKVALAKAAEVAQRTRIAPQHWLSALGL